jgi:hypothetical protein
MRGARCKWGKGSSAPATSAGISIEIDQRTGLAILSIQRLLSGREFSASIAC